MIIGIGNDLTDIRRIEKLMQKYGNKFIEKHFTKTEQEKGESLKSTDKYHAFYAKRFAAKEACTKALGTGFIDNIYLKDIGIINDKLGKPMLELSNGALTTLQTITPKGYSFKLHLSLSDEPPYAQAFVIIEAISS